jgi:hypothetical protein
MNPQPWGVVFHVGSQPMCPAAWVVGAITESATLTTDLAAPGIQPENLHVGVGFPARYGKPVPIWPELPQHARVRDTDSWRRVWGGGSDSLHLGGHRQPGFAPDPRARPVTEVLDARINQRPEPAALLTSSYDGWYARSQAAPSENLRTGGPGESRSSACPSAG